MTATDLSWRNRSAPRGHSRRRGGVLALPLVVLLGLVLGAICFIAYLLWPRWPEAPVALDAPALPITVAGVAFNVPPAAMRVPVQRRPGAHERIDLAFLWPSLAPPDATAPAKPAPATPPASRAALERLSVTLAIAADPRPPAERARIIYPPYVAAEPVAGDDGLAVLAFRNGTPYQGEDLIYDAAAPGRFLVRCSGNGAGPTPGTCLYSRRIGGPDIGVGFPPDWLCHW